MLQDVERYGSCTNFWRSSRRPTNPQSSVRPSNRPASALKPLSPYHAPHSPKPGPQTRYAQAAPTPSGFKGNAHHNRQHACSAWRLRPGRALWLAAGRHAGYFRHDPARGAMSRQSPMPPRNPIHPPGSEPGSEPRDLQQRIRCLKEACRLLNPPQPPERCSSVSTSLTRAAVRSWSNPNESPQQGRANSRTLSGSPGAAVSRHLRPKRSPAVRYGYFSEP